MLKAQESSAIACYLDARRPRDTPFLPPKTFRRVDIQAADPVIGKFNRLAGWRPTGMRPA
jgi:glutathione S-transferase